MLVLACGIRATPARLTSFTPWIKWPLRAR